MLSLWLFDTGRLGATRIVAPRVCSAAAQSDRSGTKSGTRPKAGAAGHAIGQPEGRPVPRPLTDGQRAVLNQPIDHSSASRSRPSWAALHPVTQAP